MFILNGYNPASDKQLVLMRAAIKEVMIGQSWMMKQAKQRLALPTNAQCQPVASCQPADTLLRIVGFLKSPGWNTPEVGETDTHTNTHTHPQTHTHTHKKNDTGAYCIHSHQQGVQLQLILHYFVPHSNCRLLICFDIWISVMITQPAVLVE